MHNPFKLIEVTEDEVTSTEGIRRSVCEILERLSGQLFVDGDQDKAYDTKRALYLVKYGRDIGAQKNDGKKQKEVLDG